jgi:hypothetical protein
MYTTELTPELNDLLGTTIADFDMPNDVYRRAVARYEDLARWLASYWPDSHAGGEVYPQGSIRLGTVTQPISGRDEYDIDLVCRRDLLSTSITKRELKTDVGTGLLSYAATDPDGSPSCKEGGRCWTLEYAREPFHMDILPALPDVEAMPNGILLTDKELFEWQRSNPVDFATWFRRHMNAEFIRLREAAAIAKRMEVQEVPAWEVKTTLQRTVQALKRHRDLHFVDNPKDKPASIIITTLAAMAYRGQAGLYEVLVDVVQRMPDHVENRDGVLWIQNPVHADENFADRWREHPKRRQLFFDWMEQAQRDFAGIGEERGLDTIITKLAKSFGIEEANSAADRAGIIVRKAREEGLLAVGAGATMLGAGGRTVPQHTFHGDNAEPHRS